MLRGERDERGERRERRETRDGREMREGRRGGLGLGKERKQEIGLYLFSKSIMHLLVYFR